MLTLLSYSLLTLPLYAHEQLPDSLFTPHRFYVGIGVNAGRYYNIKDDEYIGQGVLLSPSLVAGVQVLPDVALQAGVSTCSTPGRTFSMLQLDKYGSFVSNTRHTSTRRYYVVPILARFTMTKEPNIAFDLVAGATIYRMRENSTFTSYDNTNMVTGKRTGTSYKTYGSATLGAVVRVAITPQLEAAGEVRSNVYVLLPRALPTNLEVSMRYRFGAIKSPAYAFLSPASRPLQSL